MNVDTSVAHAVTIIAIIIITIVAVAIVTLVWWLWPANTNTVCMASQSLDMDGTASVTATECFDVADDGRIIPKP